LTKKMLLSLLIGASVLVTAACGNADENTNEEETATEEQATEEQAAEENAETAEQQETTEPKLEGVPDVVAEVHGAEIGKEEFERAYFGQIQQSALQAQM